MNVVSFGGETNSSALIIGLHQRNIPSTYRINTILHNENLSHFSSFLKNAAARSRLEMSPISF